MGEPFELSGADAQAWISLVETGVPHDREVRFGGVLHDLAPSELAPYFAPCELVGWSVTDKKKGRVVKAKAKPAERDAWALVAPDGSGLGGDAPGPAGPRRGLDDLRRVVDPSTVTWRSTELRAGLDFLFRGAAPSPAMVAAAEKFAAGLELVGGGDMLQFEEGKHHKLRCLPPDLSRFAAARRLSLYNCGIRQLSDAILGLPELQEITLTYTLITWITPRIGELRRLTSLVLPGAGISELPASVASLPLRTLVLRGCTALRRLPAELASVTTLQRLDLSDCPATGASYPSVFGAPAIPPDPEAAAIVEAIRAANPGCTITPR